MELYDIYKYVAPSIIAGSLIGITSYYSYIAYKQCSKIISYMNQININEDQASVVIKDKYITIKYVYLNDTYTVRLPYNGEMIPYMAQCEVYTMDWKGKEHNITQQPGVPYLIKAEDLDCHSISVCNLDEDFVRTFYNTAPIYGHVSE